MKFYFYSVRQCRRIGKKGKRPKQTRQESYGESDITGHPEHIECQRTNDSTAIRTAVIGQKGPFFVVENEKDKMIMTGHCNQDKIEKKCTGTAQDS